MRLRSLHVENFGAVQSAQVSFEDGLNVLHGPNDLGKSTLAAAIRAALLLQHGSSGARPFVPWGSARKPSVTLTLQVGDRLWRVHKVFGTTSGGKSVLEWSNDGVSWSVQEEGRAVDGKLRELLEWGLPAPGGRGGTHGFPKSFLATVLLGEQALPYRLLDQSLEADPEDTGKGRLIEALQAMATDPLYQQVLEQAQTRVDEAFTAKGKRSTRKGSPFEQVVAEIKQRREASEQLRAQVAESEAVVSRLGDLAARRDQAMARRAEAAAHLERIEGALAQATERARLQDEVDAARAVLTEIERNQEEIARLQETLRAAKAAVPEAEAEVAAASEASGAAQLERERAHAAAQAFGRGEDPQLRAQAQARDEAMRSLRAEVAAMESAQEKLRGWREAYEERAAAEAAQAQARAELDQVGAVKERADADARAAAQAYAELKDARAWARAQAQAQRLERLTERGNAAAAARSEAEGKRAAAAAIEREHAGDFPGAQEIEEIERVASDLQMREAAVRGGVRVALELSTSATVRIDGAAASHAPKDGRIDAEREVVLELPENGSVTVRPGSPGAHEALAEANAAWAPHAERLAALGLDSTASLREAARARQTQETARRGLLRDAELLEAKASAPEPAEVESTRRELESLRRGLEAADPARCRALLDARGEDLEGDVDEAEAAASAAARGASAAASAAAEVQTQLRLATQRAQEAARREQAARTEGEDPEAASQALEALGATLAERKAKLEASAEAEDAAARTRTAQAEAALASADATLQAARAGETKARAALDEARGSLSSAKAALDVRREQAAQQDSLAAAERVARAQDALSAYPVPELAVSAEAASQARAALTLADETLEDAERAVRQQEGALQQVGGQVVRERSHMATEALDEAERQEAEVTLDYDGWRLLLGTLREVENETGAHLGRALDEELAGRLLSVSQGRYRGAKLGADLETEGIVTSTGVQALDRMSEGVKEQIATLLRVSVAEHLDTTLVLDDHLAQTDPARAEWFARLLRESAEGIQVVVLTCRPGDYLGETTDGVHVVDLSQTVERA